MSFRTVALLTLLLTACTAGTDLGRAFAPNEPLAIRIEADAAATPVVNLLIADVKSRDTTGRIDWSGSPALTISAKLAADPALNKSGAFRLTGSAGAYAVAATDALGVQYGIYELLERAGIVFVHPEQTIFPASLCVDCIGAVAETAEPTYTMRGTHMHTMHPLEYESTLLGTGAEAEQRFAKYLGWLIARRQNYLQWALLRTIDHDAWIGHAKKLVAMAHARGFLLGISAPIAFRQQNSFFLYDGESPAPATAQMAQSVDWLMQAGWDRIHVEMGASEFIEVDDKGQVAWLEFLADYLDAKYPGVRTATKVHCTVNQTAPGFGGINFNYIVKFAKRNVGVMPHTVQFYDLYRAGPTYDREDFSDMREFLLGEVGKREVFYYPETAYWVTFDHDIPIFLPQYAFARWNDLYQLRASGMDGQINFSSGFEWGYWLNEYVSMWHNYAPDADYAAPIRRVISTFGAAAEARAFVLFDAYVRWQGTELLEKNGIRWLVAWDAADDVGHFVGIHAQPIAARLYEVAKYSPVELDKFEAEQLPQLREIAATLTAQSDEWSALDADVAPNGRPIYDEFRQGMAVTAVRAHFMLALYDAVVADTRGDKTAADAAFARAERMKRAALAIVHAREKGYRFPFDELGVDRKSYTSYPFGYLRTVSDLWYWNRELKMARDPEHYDFLTALYDLVDSAGL